MNNNKILNGSLLTNLSYHKISHSYPGRGIVCGLDESEKYLVQIYWIMGRSPNSRNRIFIEEADGILKTEAADLSKVKDSSLIIYTAMLSDEDTFVVSNGAQTEDALEAGSNIYGLEYGQFTENWQYEPDKPNFTPRITSVSSIEYYGDRSVEEKTILLQMSLLKKSPFGKSCERHLFSYNSLLAGAGYCITTYSGDGNPLPAFEGEPYLLPLTGTQEEILEAYWKVLDEENKISLAVKFINIDTREQKILIKNKYEKVA